jgi:heat shock protein HtpX
LIRIAVFQYLREFRIVAVLVNFGTIDLYVNTLYRTRCKRAQNLAPHGIFPSDCYCNWLRIIMAMVMNIGSYWFSDKLVLSMTGAKPVTRAEYPDFWNVVENLSIAAGLPMPKVYVVNDPAPNAFATGRDPEHAVVAATTGLLGMLDRTELEGVMAHELSHVGNRDMLVMTVAVVLAGFVAILADFFMRAMMHGNSDRGRHPIFLILGIAGIILAPIAAQLIQLAISRKREYLADASGALLTRYPEGLASALEKISAYGRPMQHASHATAHLFIADPFGGEGKRTIGQRIGGLFQTHPPAADRIRILREMGK